MYTDNYFNRFELAPEVAEALKKCKCIAYAETKEELQEMAYGPTHTSRYDVVSTSFRRSSKAYLRRRSDNDRDMLYIFLWSFFQVGVPVFLYL